jgi:hypothetical protein
MSEYSKGKRRLLRRETNLVGYYYKPSSQGVFEKIEKTTVVDLSMCV